MYFFCDMVCSFSMSPLAEHRRIKALVARVISQSSVPRLNWGARLRTAPESNPIWILYRVSSGHENCLDLIASYDIHDYADVPKCGDDEHCHALPFMLAACA